MTRGATSQLRGVLLALAGGVFWGFSASCAQYIFATDHADPQWVTAMRIIVSGIVMMAIAAVKVGPRLAAPVRRVRDAARVAAFALFGLSFTQFTYLMTIDASNAGTATVLEYAGPVLVMLIVCRRMHRLPTKREFIAVICVVAGVFLLATHGDPTKLVLTPATLFWGGLSAVSMVFYTLPPEPLLRTYDNLAVLAWALAIGGVVMAVWQHPWTNPPALTQASWIALVVGLTLLGTVGAFICYFRALYLIGPSRTSMLASVEVVTATACAVLWLGTPFSAMDLVGLAFIMATVFLLAKRDTVEGAPRYTRAHAETHQLNQSQGA